MKVTIKINDSEVILEAQEPDEFAALGPLVISILEGLGSSLPKRPKYKAVTETGSESELTMNRISAVAWVLSTNQQPMNAPEVAVGVKDEPSFYTKAGDPIHIVRRVLAEGVQMGVFLKTAGGLFTVPPDEIIVSQDYPGQKFSHLPYASTEDDMDDPFADN